ncbi:MAG: hypothetical protein QXL01_00835 [Thermoplasmatales archaeon]
MKPKKYKCPVCSKPSCGDDSHTITKYQGPEVAVGDVMKLILRQCYDLVDFHNLQKHEILGLIKASLDEHIIEEDLNEK